MIEVTFQNKETKRLYEHEVLEEIEKIMPIPMSEKKDIMNKLERGDILGFNDIHFKETCKLRGVNMNPCRSCKDDCKQCDVYIERLNLLRRILPFNTDIEKKKKKSRP